MRPGLLLHERVECDDAPAVMARASGVRRESSDALEAALLLRIRDLDAEIRRAGHDVHMGTEDELFVTGPRAHTFLAEGSRTLSRLRARFPEVGRVYPEADLVTFLGLPPLRLRGVRKWEITTRPTTADGARIPPERQARLVTEIRRFVQAEARATGHVVLQGARPLPDLREVPDGRLGLPRRSERHLLESFHSQLHLLGFRSAHELQFRRDRAAEGFAILGREDPRAPAVERVEALRELLGRGSSVGVARILGERAASNLQDEVEHARSVHRRALAELARSVRESDSLLDLIGRDPAPLHPQAVPGCGVDLNISLVGAEGNAFHSRERGATGLFFAVARELVRATGSLTGSMLPAIQSYGPQTYQRMFRADIGASSRAALGPKATGAFCKLSPDPVEVNPGRAVEHDHDRFSSVTARLEFRLGEPGSLLQGANPLAHPQYVLLAMIAVRNGLQAFRRDPDIDPRADEEQPLDLDHSAAFRSYQRSELLRDGYGRQLHDRVVRHAESSILL